MCKDPTLIEQFWLMQMLGKFGAKWNLYFIFSGFAPSLSKNCSRATERSEIYRRYKSTEKNWNIARNI